MLINLSESRINTTLNIGNFFDMRLFQFIFISLLFLLPLSNASAQVTYKEFEEGVAAANKGEFEKAMALWQPLLDLDYAPALYEMGVLYEFGFGVKKDIKKAAEHYLLAAEKGDYDAQFSISLLLSDGRGIEKNLEQALYWMKRSAVQGTVRAQFNLALMYSNGLGTPQDYKEAVVWYQKAANNNYVKAQFNLALMYYEGNGVKKSQEMSYVWNYIASYSEYEPAMKSRDFDARKMTRKEILSAQQKAELMYEKIAVQQ